MSYANRSERLQRQIDDAIADGWRVESETPERVVLVKRNYGSIGVHLVLAVLTGWWSFGVVNLVYGAYKYLNDSQRRVLREGSACPECGASVAPSASYCQNCGTDLPGTAAADGTAAAAGSETPTERTETGTGRTGQE